MSRSTAAPAPGDDRSMGRVWHTKCPVHGGKRCYIDKSAARRSIRDLHERGMREYRCHELGAWHIGHLPHEVRRGELTIHEYRILKAANGVTSTSTAAADTENRADRAALVADPESLCAAGPLAAQRQPEPTE